MKKVKAIMKEKGFILAILYLLYSSIYIVIRMIIIKLLNHKSVDDSILTFMSRPDFSDNSKVLYDYLIKKYPNKKFIWITENNYKSNIDNTIFINYSSKYHSGPTIKSLYYASKSKYVFYTHFSPLYDMKSKKDQVIINLWHGCGFKNDVKSTTKYFEKNYFDYVLVPGPIFKEIKSRFFGCDKKRVLDIGYPRYDLLINDNKEVETFVKKLKMNNRLVIWMPTFRKTNKSNYPESNIEYSYDLPLLKSNEDIIKLNEKCKNNNIILVIKRHPMQVKYNAESLNLSNIIFIDNNYLVNHNIELYSFLRYTDALISDYSSISIDYLLLDKQIGYILTDFEEYNNARGFVFEKPLDYMPGDHIYTYNDLITFINNVNNKKDNYSNKRNIVRKLVHNECNNYCERIKNEIINS